jgi:hypothetical protein
MIRKIVLTVMALILAIAAVQPILAQDVSFGGRGTGATSSRFAVPQIVPGLTNQGVTGASNNTGLLNNSLIESTGVQPNRRTTFNVTDVGVGDFNGDGLQDIAAVSDDTLASGARTGSLVVYVGSLDGTFGLPLNINLTVPATSVSVGDIELDGLSDIAVAEFDPISGSGVVDVYSGGFVITGGFGPFDILQSFLGADIVSIAFGRLNGDAFQDIVLGFGALAPNTIAVISSDASILSYNTDVITVAGTVGSVGSGATAVAPVVRAPRAITVGVSNVGELDGDQDIAIATSSGLEFIENLTLDGGVTVLDGLSTVLIAGTAPTGAVVADLNNDGLPDAIALNRGSGNISSFIGNSGGGYSAPRVALTGANPVSLSLINFDGDATIDVLVANRGSLPGTLPGNVVVLRGTGAVGNFVNAATFSLVSTGDSIFNPQSVAVGQFDVTSPTDDIVVAEGSSVALPGGVYFLSAGQGYFPIFLQTITATSLTADFDGSGGFNDIAVIEQNFGLVLVLLNVNIGAPPSVGRILLRDLFTNRNNAPTSATAFVDAQTGRNNIAITDIATPQNNTGFGQIVVGINDGSGNFSDNRRFRQFTATPGATNILNGDFNGDAADDLVYIDFNSNQATVALNDGTNFFLNNNSRETAGFVPVSARIADVNDDDFLDLVVLNQGATIQGNQTIVSVLLGTGDGRLRAATSLLQVPNFGISMIGGNADFGATGIPRIVDFNSDGFPDFAVASTRGAVSSIGLFTPTVSILLNRPDAPGNFNISNPIPLIDDTASNQFSQLDLEDTAAGPGLVSGRGGIVNNGIGVGGANYLMGVADFNADAFPDLVVTGTLNNLPSNLLFGTTPFRSAIYLIGGETNGNLRVSRPQRAQEYTLDGIFLAAGTGIDNPLSNGGDTFVATATGNFAPFNNLVPDTVHLSLNGNLWVDGNISSILNHAPILTIRRTDLNAPNPGGGRKVIITAGQSFTIPVTGFDIDTTDRLTFRLAQTPTGENPPSFVSLKDNGDKTATITVNSGDINRGPGNAVFRIAVEATDAGSSGPGGRLPLIGREYFTVVVQPNTPPTIGSVPNQTVEAGKTATVNLIVSDKEGQTITNTIACDKGSFATISGTTLTLAPQAGDVGTATCTITVTDQFGLNSSTSFAVTVTPQNLPPTLAAIQDQTVKAGATATVNVSANDPNGNVGLRLSLTSAPAFVSLSDNGNGTGVIRITPALTDTQGGRVTIQVTDPAGLTAQASFNVTVQKTVTIGAASFDTGGKQLFISGSGFGTSGARVTVNGTDVSARIIGQSDNSITVKGGRKKLSLRSGPNQVVVTSGGVASNTFIVNLLKGNED